MRQTLRQGALGVAGLLALFALWWLGVALFGAADGLSARSPQATLLSLGELLERRELYEHVLVSLKRVLLGLFLALLVGVPLGCWWAPRATWKRRPLRRSSSCG